MRRRVIVHGHVQGVFFRDTVRTAAMQRGVAGWVRNNPDGTVEAVFEGEEGQRMTVGVCARLFRSLAAAPAGHCRQ